MAHAVKPTPCSPPTRPRSRTWPSARSGWVALVAAIVNVVALWAGRQRSTMNVVASTLTVTATLFFGFFVIGEGLGGA